jgi:NADH-quinone oxidoreductase subunit N
MSRIDIAVLMPLLITGGAVVAVMLLTAFRRSHASVAATTFVAAAAALVSVPCVASLAPHRSSALIIIDGYALFYMGLIFAGTCFVTMIAYDYFERRSGQREEFYLLLLLATLGSAVLVSSSHFASLFLGLEILSVSLYALIAFHREQLPSVEAGVKYLVLAGASSAFLLFGMALLYLERGDMGFLRGAPYLTGDTGMSLIALAGVALLIVGIGFKLALVPFHMWTPDVYEGAPPPATAFVASVSKGAAFVLLLRYFTAFGLLPGTGQAIAISLIAIATMLAGNLLALRERKIRRILAYSSIAHMGYLLVALQAAGPLAPVAAGYYLVAYFTAIIGLFGIISVREGREGRGDDMTDYSGFAWQHPWLGASFTVMLLSLAGIPLTVGFVGKFYLLAAGLESNLRLQVFILVTGSAISIFYYLRVVIALYSAPRMEGNSTQAHPSVSIVGRIALSALTLFLIWFGVYPGPMLRLIQQVVKV